MNRMKLGAKLTLGFGAIALIALVLGGISYFGASINAGNIEAITGQSLPAQRALLVFQDRADVVKGCTRTLLNTAIPPAIRTRQYDLVANARKDIAESWKRYEEIPREAAEDAVWKEFGAAWAELRIQNTKFTNWRRHSTPCGSATLSGSSATSPIFAPTTTGSWSPCRRCA